MTKLRIAIIGQGRSGYDIHALAISGLSDMFTIAAVSDPIEERRMRAVKEFGCDAYVDYKSLLPRDDLDFVVNTLPSHLHASVSMELLDAGFNVISEKPAARYVSEIDALIEKAKEVGKLLTVYQQHRFSPAFLKIRSIIDSGVIGRVVMVKIDVNNFTRRWDWQTLKSYCGGNLLNTGPHFLDQALQLFGTDTMPKISSFMDNANAAGDAEDHVKVLLTGEGKSVVDMEISSCCAYPGSMYQVYGTTGGISGNLSHLDWRYFKPEESASHVVVMNTSEIEPDNLKWYEESWDLPKEQSDLWPYMARCYYTDLYDAWISGRQPSVSMDEIRQQVAVIEECHRQSEAVACAG